MAKSPEKRRTQRPVQSTTKRTTKNKGQSEIEPGGTDKRCCPDCAGKPSGTMGACEDDTCRDIPPPQGGNGPWVLYCDANVNEGFPYWERVANVEAVLRQLARQADQKFVT